LLTIWEKKLKNRHRSRLNREESRKTNKNKSKRWDNFKKKLPTDKPSLMLWEPKELLRPTKELQERKIELKLRLEPKKLKNFKKLGWNSNLRKKGGLSSKPRPRNHNLKQLSGSKESWRRLRIGYRRRESSCCWSMLMSWRSRSLQKRRTKSRPRSWRRSRTRNSRRLGRLRSTKLFT